MKLPFVYRAGKGLVPDIGGKGKPDVEAGDETPKATPRKASADPKERREAASKALGPNRALLGKEEPRQKRQVRPRAPKPAVASSDRFARVAQRTERRSSEPGVGSSNLPAGTKPKTDRKEYLKLKARERRKREKAAKP